MGDDGADRDDYTLDWPSSRAARTAEERPPEPRRAPEPRPSGEGQGGQPRVRLRARARPAGGPDDELVSLRELVAELRAEVARLNQQVAELEQAAGVPEDDPS